MLKLLSGWCPGYRRAFDLTGSDAMYNWDWPEKLDGLSVGKTWPMLINNEASIARFKAWALGQVDEGFDHVLWHNEPPIPNPGAAIALAEWTNAKRAELIADNYLLESDTNIVGNFLVRPGGVGANCAWSYNDIAAEVGWFYEALDFPAILGIHLYNDEADATPVIAAMWQDEQLYDIRQDYDTFAITEWGDLTTLWRAGHGPDISAYSAYMRDVWQFQQNYDCYASSWYVGCASSDTFKNADFVLTDQDGALRPLGEVWRDLPTGGNGPPGPPPTHDQWVTVYEMQDVYRVQEWRQVNG